MAGALKLGARAGAVTLFAQGLKFVIAMAGTVALARLLQPEDFGLVAMVGAFVALGEVVRDLGTSVVGLGRRELSHQQASNLFWLSSALGGVCAAILVLSTPILVQVFNEPRLAKITPALAAQLLLAGISAQFMVQLAREMRYWRRLVLDVVPVAGALVAAVFAAVLGLGYWALVIQAVAAALLRLPLSVLLSGWRPSRLRRGAGNRALVTDSSAFGLAHLAGYVSQNIDTVLIGARWDAASLGTYNQAYQLLTLPNRQMVGPLTQVVIPTVNRAIKEGRSADDVLLRVQFGLGLAVNMVYVVSAGVAPWLIPFALGDQWTDTVPIFRILAAGGAVWVFSTVSYWGFIVGNIGRQLLAYNVVTKGLTALLIFGASFISPEAIAWAVSIGLIVSWPINLVWLKRTAGQGSMKYFQNGMTILAGSVTGYLATAWLFGAATGLPGWVAASVSAIAGTLAFLVVIATVPGGAVQLHSAFRMSRAALRA